ncbi:MAG: VWA domain-containing protein [Myxococcaceae bacterium]|nr:VWA domain-containing protein [Myxococcaceae bacterium]
MRRFSCGALCCFLVACGPDPYADRRPDERGLTELRHDVRVRFEEGQVRLTVSRQVRNDTDDEQTFLTDVPLPEGAIATSLRVGRGDGPLAQAPLSTIERVTAEWERLTGEGEAEPSPIGRLVWVWDGTLRLEVFAVPPRDAVTVAYDVLAPTRYGAGLLFVELPAPEGLPPRFDGATVEEVDGTFRVQRQHVTQPVADVRWATAPLDVQRVLWRLEVDAAPVLEPAPIAPHVVFVIDASHSEGPAGIAAQLDLVPHVLANTPEAQAEVVVVRRAAERLFGTFLPVRDVPARLAAEAHRLAPGNGSNLEEGARLAAQTLAGVPGPARVLLFTDERLRTSFTNERALAALEVLPRDSVVHVVERTSADDAFLREERDDAAPLAPVAEAWGGVFFRVSGDARQEAPGDAARALLELVRPTRVDALHVEAARVDLGLQPSLQEGSTIRLHGVAEHPPELITLTGKLWSRPFRRVVAVDDGLSRRLPGLAIGQEDLRTQLEDDELRSAAFLAQAVSPVTAYLAAPPNAAPSRIGSLGLGMAGVGTSSCGCGGSSCSVAWVTVRPALVDLHALLRDALEPGQRACEAQLGLNAPSRVIIETTGDEVVDVEVAGANAAMTACLTEAAWAVRLPDVFLRSAGPNRFVLDP